MRAGQLRHRIVIEQPHAGRDQRDSLGQLIDKWTETMRVWASVTPINGAEQFPGDRVRSSVTHQVVIRHDPEITSKMRVIHKGRILNIVATIDPEEREKETRLLCVEQA